MAATITDTTAADRLLVVDERGDTLKILRPMLGRLGFEIIPASNGNEALRVVSSCPPDLILLDPVLSGMDGFTLCQRIQENADWAGIPIIFLSEAGDKNMIVRALESGGVDYVTKPFHKTELIARVRTQLMLKTTRDHLRRLAQDKDEVISIVSHHLQNHLAGMQMGAQLLLDRAPQGIDPEVRLIIENIRSSSSQMTAFVKAFLANAAADHGITIKLEPVNLPDAIARAVRQYEAVAVEKEIALISALPAEPMMVEADPAALDQVLVNLISNAIKFSPSGKEVLVTGRPGPDYLECRIQDRGAGFTEHDKARMFGRYARLSARPTGGEPSTGLGLSIAKKLMRSMRGELTCESVAGHGATFILRFPRMPENS